ncbi:MAG: sugar ABC transporter ATP-binding protein [Rhizobiales bacterium]|nr:sugar ABC transporter ATP-binding protein [Hyphomicrobiales bacterium]MBO6698324.1 sugar ABC transporter ATP-binding protein [Hyphomicrobiales bacterium]MBO6735422.1 sugar ABC transporter ATP-binding protein [Hyphomicrobiales bacterium]MBO6910770.1 sugar ABC transporter ATP-binding protein [Hyphomicrobiales bacterium]MBO6956511.1 sugar ABC transporter ATP-binding protein [Hyphomicrobiales bacterium]
MSEAPRLSLHGITKRFPGVTALDDVSFDVRAGEVHAFMGENGAGKSTLMKIGAGIHQPNNGHIEVAGARVTLNSPSDATALGIHTVFQELTVLPNLDVGQNIMIGQEPMHAGVWLDTKTLYGRAQAILERLHIKLDARTPIARLSAGQRQMVEIARACGETPKVLVLDEPTSSLGRQEEELLFDLVDRLRAAGVGIVYITHRMSEVFRLADRITVLRDGKHVVTGPAEDFTREKLIAAMVGRAVDERRSGKSVDTLPVALDVSRLSRGSVVRDVSFELHTGEVLGVAGLMGAGRTELARLMAGVDQPDRGTMRLFGAAYAPRSVSDAIARGVAYLPEDRKTQGLVLSLSVADNIALPSLGRISRSGVLSLNKLRALATTWSEKLGIRAASPDVAADTLSGGNQQKVAIAKWLAIAPKVILLDEPTRGVDVGAKAEIYALIRQLAADGAAVMVISSELPEVLQISDRIAVMAAGRIAGVVPADDASEESLLDLAFAESGNASEAA